MSEEGSDSFLIKNKEPKPSAPRLLSNKDKKPKPSDTGSPEPVNLIIIQKEPKLSAPQNNLDN